MFDVEGDGVGDIDGVGDMRLDDDPTPPRLPLLLADEGSTVPSAPLPPPPLPSSESDADEESPEELSAPPLSLLWLSFSEFGDVVGTVLVVDGAGVLSVPLSSLPLVAGDTVTCTFTEEGDNVVVPPTLPLATGDVVACVSPTGEGASVPMLPASPEPGDGVGLVFVEGANVPASPSRPEATGA